MCLDPTACPRHQAITLPERGADFFSGMCLRLAGAGGLMSEEALQARLHRQGRSYVDVAAWLDEGRLRGIAWGSQCWLPMFQLTPSHALRTDVAAVADELTGAMDDLEILAWFVCPNAALGRRTPLACLPGQLVEVMEAARVDRFLASG